ncbi:MAG: hypothetical protein KKD07_10095 [Candidatus Omnitrophica bacterium]|nr:hypothetical protein [Candidatus Omnitrophota bacterium]MBU1997720.1 hypothetical protein [Candidatus Omnitrophota bacterium]MBU4334778.1 hypothetical protein [Candidatus Omnitrophota bacterium]
MIKKSETIRKQHIRSFEKMNYLDRLVWAFSQNQTLSGFMTPESKRINRKLRKKGKKYFGS